MDVLKINDDDDDKRCSGISGKLKSNVDFHCRRCLEREREHGLFQSVLLKD